MACETFRTHPRIHLELVLSCCCRLAAWERPLLLQVVHWGSQACTKQRPLRRQGQHYVAKRVSHSSPDVYRLRLAAAMLAQSIEQDQLRPKDDPLR